MKIYIIIIILSLTLFQPVPEVLHAEPNPLITEDQKQVKEDDLIKLFPNLKRKITIDLKGIDATNVLNFLATKGEFNIVSSAAVTGRVSLLLKEVTIAEALKIVIKANKLAYNIIGSTIFMMSEEEYEQEFGKKFYDKRDMKIIQLKYASSKDISAILETLKSTVGSVIVDHTTGTVILIDMPQKIKIMAELINKIERPSIVRDFPTITKIFNLEYATTEEIKPTIIETLSKDIGIIRSDKRTNTLIITDIPQKMEEIEKIISTFDAKTLQVLIKSKIVQVRLSDELNFGINWENLFKSSANLNMVGAFPISSSVGTSGQKLSIGTVADNDFTYVFNILKEIGDTNLLSSPHIIASNNEESKIMVGTREAFVTSTVTTGQTTTTTAENIEFVDVGVKLTVTPTINKKGFVTMKIRPEVSSVTNVLTTSQGSSVPIIETSEAETNVTVKDGVTIIIAGLIKDDKITSEKRIPFLGDIPFLGALFRSKSNKTLKTELIVFITPKIISGEESIVVMNKEIKKIRPKKDIVSIGGKNIRPIKKF